MIILIRHERRVNRIMRLLRYAHFSGRRCIFLQCVWRVFSHLWQGGAALVSGDSIVFGGGYAAHVLSVIRFCECFRRGECLLHRCTSAFTVG